MTSSDETRQERAGAPARRRASARARGRRRATPGRPPRRLRLPYRGVPLRGPSRRANRLLGFAVLPIALMLTTFAVAGPSYSAFNRTTSTAANNWASGTVALVNNSSGTNAQTGAALFSLTGLQPGATGVKCVTVTSSSSVASAVALYASNVTPSGAGNLPSYVTVSVAMGTGSSGTNGDCTGFTQTNTLTAGARLDTLPTTYGTGATPWSPTAGGDTRVFKFTYTVDMTTPNTLQNSTATATFVWEAQST